MPHFCNCGADTYICQKCHQILCSQDHPSQWRTDITGSKQAGNVCPDCVARFEGRVPPHSIPKKEEGPISLYEHCRRESGFTDHNQVMRYLNRHYGHG